MSEAHRPRRRLRSIGAVVAGLLLNVVLGLGTDTVLHATGVYPPWFEPMAGPQWLLAIAYRIVYGVAGSYITARLAPDRPMGHALVLGTVGLAISIAGAVTFWDAGPEYGPHWYPLVVAAIAMPCAWAGGKLRVMQLRASKREEREE